MIAVDRVCRTLARTLAPLFLVAAAAAPTPVDPLAVADEFAATGDALRLDEDRADRMAVSVNINGRGPFAFIVDTGAERTVISRELADDLGLSPGNPAILHTMSGISPAETVIIDELGLSQLRVRRIVAPALSRRNLGASGLLGIDSLQSRRVVLDFATRTITIVPATSREERSDADTIVVRARSRLGRLILVDVTLNGRKVSTVLDTGSQVTVGNDALKRLVLRNRANALVAPIELTSVTGGLVMADYAPVAGLRIGDLGFGSLPIAFADLHIFRQLGFDGKPALILGMDVLRAFSRVSVDFANRTVRFKLVDAGDPPTSG